MSMYDKGLSPYMPSFTPEQDFSRGQRAVDNLLAQIDQAQKQQRVMEALNNPFVRAYAERIAGDPRLPKQGNYNSPLYPEAGRGVEGLAPVVGIPQPMQSPGRIPRALAQQIVNETETEMFGAPAVAEGDGVSLTIGEPVITGVTSNEPLPYSDFAYEPDEPRYETTVRAKRIKPAMADMNPAHTPAPLMPPLFGSPEEFEMFSKMLPYGTQRDVTEMQSNASMENKRIETDTKNRTASLKASVDLLAQMNKRLMNQETLAARLKAAQLKAKKGDVADLLKLAKEAADQANEMDRLLANDVVAALETQPEGSEARNMYLLHKQKADQLRAYSQYTMQLASQSYGVPYRNPVQTPQKSIDEMSDEELQQEIARERARGG